MPFVLLSFGLGAFALLPYYALPSPRRSSSGYKIVHFGNHRRSGIHRIAGHKLTHGILLLLNVGTAFYGFTQGNSAVYMEAFRQIFLYPYDDDFVLLTLLSVIALFRDSVFSRRSRIWAFIGLIPLIGPLLYLIVDRRSTI
ncbi:hypothetical protein [Paenibacillus sp. MABNR03]|uniref:hypothetical protein n=1 Tax=Paenibacillus sp. MABNR03 TaxID=3142626 RepID=UPI003D29EDF8